MITLSLAFGAGFFTAMAIYEKARLISWIKASGAWFHTQWQKVTKKG